MLSWHNAIAVLARAQKEGIRVEKSLGQPSDGILGYFWLILGLGMCPKCIKMKPNTGSKILVMLCCVWGRF